MKTNLEDVTFLMPVRLDSVVRIENLLATINHIYSNYTTNIYILEAASFENGIIRNLLGDKVRYQFVKDMDPIFHRTKYRNILIQEVETPFLSVWDTDVIIGDMQITTSVNALRSSDCEISYPYDGRFLDTTPIIRSLYFEKYCDFNVLYEHQDRMHLLYGNKHIGGAFLIDTKKYIESGLENEVFYGWGPEDFERHDRWVNLGYRIHRTSGVSFHLSHPRDINGNFNSQLQRDRSNSELRKTRLSSTAELYSRCKIFD